MSAKKYIVSASLAALFVAGAAFLAQAVTHFSELTAVGPRVGLIETAIAAAVISPLWLSAQRRVDRS